ncbi:uncharacterized protein LOC126894438 [Daktulosphaira vitifoliae]|uniref:uncharacterized protein LOC126894438 n=1 Tax=Daktulosphaira vitifoliae TaxID=58002 RepID=UPI0021AACB4D|nr:uncharacterized protein LOC126894438 [Daktulosphaira vitifoliae]
MKGALHAIDSYHNIPMINKIKNRFILRKVLTNLQENEDLNKLVSFSINMDSIKNTLLSIEEILSNRKCELEEDLSFCELKPFDLELLWNLWNMEFDTLKSQGIYQELYIFLNDKIKDLILTTIWKKYIELGFKFDLNTSQTFLPTPPTNDNQDSIQNHDHTNEVDILEKNQQHDVLCEEKNDSNLQIEYTDDNRPFYKFI